MTQNDRRYIQIYTGDGKGKTTAAIGQAIRAAGSGLKSFIVMFMKTYPYGEIKVLEHLRKFITVEQYGDDEFVFRKEPPADSDIATARNALERARMAMLSGDYDIVILDEVCVCVYFKLLKVDELMPLFDSRPEAVELILTGRYCPPEWIERADLVTEMKEIKHYYLDGVLSRPGFES
jgi:cob(I)alamin adenosyltransferase